MIVVLGMRSGTSLVSQILHKSGVCMGREFQGPTPFNQTGYFENLEFLNYVVSLHEDLGRKRFANPIKREDLDKVPLRKYYALRDLMNKYRSGSWGVKVPTLAYLIPLIELFDTPSYIICLRDHGEMASSISKYGHDVPKNFDWLKFIDSYTNVCENYTFDKRRIKVDYHSMLSEPHAVIKKITKFTGVGTDRVDELANLVRPDLNHESPRVEGKSIYRPTVRVSPNPPMTFMGEGGSVVD